MESKELEVKLFNEYLLKENKELKYILIVNKDVISNKTSITIVETNLIVSIDSTDSEVIENFIASNHFFLSDIIYSEIKVVKNEEERISAADYIYEEYLKFSEQNFESKIANYDYAVNLYNSSLIPRIHLFPSKQIGVTKDIEKEKSDALHRAIEFQYWFGVHNPEKSCDPENRLNHNN
tara:strand:- start:1158 stop:1694 length:537 start_codon:yes stop_codon:yes gene_type:complete